MSLKKIKNKKIKNKKIKKEKDCREKVNLGRELKTL